MAKTNVEIIKDILRLRIEIEEYLKALPLGKLDPVQAKRGAVILKKLGYDLEDSVRLLEDNQNREAGNLLLKSYSQLYPALFNSNDFSFFLEKIKNTLPEISFNSLYNYHAYINIDEDLPVDLRVLKRLTPEDLKEEIEKLDKAIELDIEEEIAENYSAEDDEIISLYNELLSEPDINTIDGLDYLIGYIDNSLKDLKQEKQIQLRGLYFSEEKFVGLINSLDDFIHSMKNFQSIKDTYAKIENKSQQQIILNTVADTMAKKLSEFVTSPFAFKNIEAWPQLLTNMHQTVQGELNSIKNITDVKSKTELQEFAKVIDELRNLNGLVDEWQRDWREKINEKKNPLTQDHQNPYQPIPAPTTLKENAKILFNEAIQEAKSSNPQKGYKAADKFLKILNKFDSTYNSAKRNAIDWLRHHQGFLEKHKDLKKKFDELRKAFPAKISLFTKRIQSQKTETNNELDNKKGPKL